VNRNFSQVTAALTQALAGVSVSLAAVAHHLLEQWHQPGIMTCVFDTSHAPALPDMSADDTKGCSGVWWLP
jgi:hypothetical protein